METFGSVLTAMVTPFDANHALDLTTARDLARRLTAPGSNDGLVLNGTTGEAATTSDDDKARLIAAVRDAVPMEVRLIAGVGTADTAHSIALAQAAHESGADGLLVVSPYYSRPSQAGALRHFTDIADSTPLPVMLYDIPKRTGLALRVRTLTEVARHERIIAVKDATGGFETASRVIPLTTLAYYSGDDLLNLPALALGFTGFVSVTGHLVADRLRTMRTRFLEGDVTGARVIHESMLALATGLFRAPAAASVKAALSGLGRPCGAVRLPLVDLTEDERHLLAADLETARVRP